MTGNSPRDKSAKHTRGLGQLTLVEHALCPLGTATDLNAPIIHRNQFKFVDPAGKRQTSTAVVTAPFGLRPSDEFFLWSLLGLTFSQPEPSPEFRATPHFILKQLGCVNARSNRGGSAYRGFRDALRRLAAVNYWSDAFYDPSRREHRETSFGFLSYSLPLDPASSRVWRIVWDPLFFEFCQGAAGCLAFDLTIYRQLDPAARRLYLFLAKLFWRREWTHWMDVKTLAVDVLGFSPTIALRNLKQKVKRAILRLGAHNIVHVTREAETKQLFVDRDDGGCILRLRRGPSFRRISARTDLESLAALSIYEPLRSIGLDDKTIAWVARNFGHNLVQQWADITLAAKERQGMRFFKNSPQAYFMDNLRQAAEAGRTPPDWWWDCKREEEQRSTAPTAERLFAQLGLTSRKPDLSGADADRAFVAYLQGEGRAAFEIQLRQVFDELCRGGTAPEQAQRIATHQCVQHFRQRFNVASCR